MLKAWPFNLKTYLTNNPADTNGKAIYNTNVYTIAADIALNALVPASPKISSSTPPTRLKACARNGRRKNAALFALNAYALCNYRGRTSHFTAYAKWGSSSTSLIHAELPNQTLHFREITH